MNFDTLSPLKAARFDKLLDAAETVFLRDGLRGATIEGIAAAAGMSKVTVYGYLKDKDAAFAAVARRLAERIESAFMVALDAPGPIQERAIAAITGKHDAVHDLVRTSGHAAELLAARSQVREFIAEADQRMIERLSVLLNDAQAARILFAGALGIANTAATKLETQGDIKRLVFSVLRSKSKEVAHPQS